MRELVPGSGSTPNRTTVFGGLAITEIVVRTVATPGFLDPVAISERAFVAVTVGLAEGWIGQTIGEILMWSLYGYLLYTLLPELLPGSVAGLADDRTPLLLLALGAVVLAQPVADRFATIRSVANLTFQASGSNTWVGWIERTLLLAVAWLGVMTAYLRVGRDGPPHADEGGLARLLDADEVTQIRRTNATDRTVPQWVVLLLNELLPSTVLTMLCLFLGLLAGVLTTFYPLPELLFVGVGVVGVAGSKLDDQALPGRGAVDVDLEGDVGRALATALRGQKGIAITVPTVLGVFNALYVFLYGIRAITRAGEGIHSAGRIGIESGPSPGSVARLTGALSGVGVAVTAFVSAGCLLWVWSRLARRSPAFVTAWTRRWGDESGARPVVDLDRPPGAVVVPYALVFASLPVLFTDDPTSPLRLGYAGLWPLGLLAVVGWIRLGRRRPTRSPLSDNWWYPISVGVGFVFVRATALEGTRLGTFLAGSLWIGLAFLAVLLFHFGPELQWWLERAGHPWAAVRSGAYLLPIVPLLGTVFEFPRLRSFLYVTAVILFAIVAALVVYQSRNRNC
jgi:putative effector of murein hydrolase LrgA (UPF0299 family)